MRDRNGNFILTLASQQRIQVLLESQTLLESTLSVTSPVVTIKANTPLYNAQGTANDVIYADGKLQNVSNIRVWQHFTKQDVPFVCDNKGCDATDPFAIVGAHMVLDSDKVWASAGDTFYLVPICNGCNHTTKPIVFNHPVKAVVLVAQ